MVYVCIVTCNISSSCKYICSLAMVTYRMMCCVDEYCGVSLHICADTIHDLRFMCVSPDVMCTAAYLMCMTA